MEAISRRDLDFLLHDWLEVEALTALDRFAGQSRADYDAVLDLAGRLALNDFLPSYKAGDREEPRLDENGEVIVQPDIARAVRRYLDAGLHLASVDAEHGGMQLPATVSIAAMAQIMAANIAASGFAMLSIGNARVITSFGTPAQIATFAQPQFEGAALGTMCLSEPDVGSSLGDITTRAMAEGEDALGGRFRLKGHKMWISAGGQNVTDNIVHLVLAKIADADGSLPPGTKGISLFIVPKILPESAGGGRNDVTVAGLNHKMGYRGTPNCLLNFGEGGAGATGWLIGKPGAGLAIMFQMMNEARINVGLGAAALACRGHLLSRAYAAERAQGRPLTDKKAAAPVPIIRHPDVRRMLLAQKALAEGALALCLYSARLADRAQAAATAEERSRAHALLDLLTPVTKSWPSEQGLVANHLAIQVHGGYGYTRDFDVEQLYRDNRLNPIHEGTTGIQGLDLLGRKMLFDGLAGFELLAAEMAATSTAVQALPELAAMAAAHDAARADVAELLRAEAARGAPAETLSNATPFLHAFGHLVVGWLWLDMARTALATRGAADGFAQGKLWACRYFYDFEMPMIAAWLAPLRGRSAVTVEVPEDCL